ncbi:MAG: RluA family pseudouridine synthase [Synergistaceae bacterium]|jgi:23S rRNA pseudouridine955/2504/2580 synthase|nr:RluA family pseudouridine synthase [Synergistaceae bacterium]
MAEMKNPNEAPKRRHGSFIVTPDQEDRRLDRVLRGLYPGVPLSAIMKSIRRGDVRVGGAKSAVAARLAAGDVVSVPWAAEGAGTENGSERARPQEKRLNEKLNKKLMKTPKLRTLLKTGAVWFIEKPPGLLSQPDSPGGDSVVTRAWAELEWHRADFRPALVGRLDRNVSGAMMIALEAPALRLLWRLMSEGLIKKIYRAIVLGRPEDEGEIDIPLQKDETGNRVTAGEGLQALTRYRVLEAGKKFSLVELELVTGRPHQARAHMSAIGHPIAGDFKYGGGRSGLENGTKHAKNRIFLHAYSLGLPNVPGLPGDVRGIAVISPLPEEFEGFL